VNKTKVVMLFLGIVVLGNGLLLTGYKVGMRERLLEPVPRPAAWGPWNPPIKSEVPKLPGYIQFRWDTNSGLAEMREVEKTK
jgi:hypothetical protein